MAEINVYRDLEEAVLYWTESCTSTQDAILELLNLPYCPSVVGLFAGSQTAGKGQRGNSWTSNPDHSLSLTIALSIDENLERDWVLSNKILSTYICEIIEEKMDTPVQLKWPNDVFVSDKKMGGMLMQIHQDNSGRWLLLGIGLNVVSVPEAVGNIATYLNAYTSIAITVSELAEILVGRIKSLVINRFSDVSNLVGYKEKYRQKLWRVNQEIMVDFYDNEKVVESRQVTLLDVDDAGRLVIDEGNQIVKSYHHGQVRIAMK